jgi:trk system potassium uptake protein TrkA
MKIIIVGVGKVGATLAEQLAREGHDVTVIDRRAEALRQISEQLDIMAVEGNGATLAVQLEAGVDSADLVIAVTSTDELNLLTCLIAKKSGARHTIARVRNPEYIQDLSIVKEELGLSLSVNPEMAAAAEIARLLRFPSAIKVDTFAKGRVELLQIRIPKTLVGLQLKDMSRFKTKVLICAVERGDTVTIPGGHFQLKEGDRISFVASAADSASFLKQIGFASTPIRSVMLVGGGRIGFYLAVQLLAMGMAVTIIETDVKRCEELSEALPKATIIHGDGTNQQLLLEEGLAHMDAFAALTGIDEENILMGLYAAGHSGAKIITKLNRTAFEDVIGKLDLGSVFYPRYIAAENIVRYVRAMQNSYGSNVETLYQIVNNKAEALEFRVSHGSRVCGIPLEELHFRKNVLIACINRQGKILIPRGSDTIEPGDTVVVVTTNQGLDDLNDILDSRHGSEVGV